MSDRRNIWVVVFFGILTITFGICSGADYSATTKEDSVITKVFNAAENGNASAQYTLGEFYMHGTHVKQDFGKAAVWYQKAAAQGSPRAQAALARMYEYGQGLRKDLGAAIKLYQAAATHGNASSIDSLGRLADEGNAEARFNLGQLYEAGIGDRYGNRIGLMCDYAGALAQYRRAARAGHQEARLALDRILGECSLNRTSGQQYNPCCGSLYGR